MNWKIYFCERLFFHQQQKEQLVASKTLDKTNRVNMMTKDITFVALREPVANKSKGLSIKSICQNDPSKSNETKAQPIPLSSFLYQILRKMTL